jgi:hypothetical protein
VVVAAVETDRRATEDDPGSRDQDD